MTNTLATMMVPISAPIWVKAPRPLNTWVKPIGQRDEKNIADRAPAPPRAGRAASGTAPRRASQPTARLTEAMTAACDGGEIEHRLVDQEQVGAEIVDQHQQREARQPGRVGFPFEPGQLVRHLRRRHQVFHHVVEAAAMDLPCLALDAGGQPGPRPQAEVEMDEIERAADPGDAGDDMQPAKRWRRPIR